MDAMILGYPPEQAGQISVTATPEEWRKILRDLDDAGYRFGLLAESGNLIDQLKSFGIEA